MINVDPSFIAHVEDPKSEKSFNLDHVNALANAFDCKVWDLLPEYPIEWIWKIQGGWNIFLFIGFILYNIDIIKN